MVAGQIDLYTGGERWSRLSRPDKDPDEKANPLEVTGFCPSQKGEWYMRRKSKRTPGIEEAHPFSGMSRVNPNAGGVDIGAVEIVASVTGADSAQTGTLTDRVTKNFLLLDQYTPMRKCSWGSGRLPAG